MDSEEEIEKIAENTEQNVYSEALKLFLAGKKPVDVAIKLGLGYEETRRIYLQFLKLNRVHKLKELYDELGDKIRPFLLLYGKMVENNYSIEQIADAVKLIDSLPQLEERYYGLNTETTALESKRRKLFVSATMLKSQIDEAKREIEFYRNQSETVMKELSALNSEINAKKNFIENFDNEEGYMRIKEAAKNQSENVMQNNRQLLGYAVTATFEAIRRYPAIQDLFFQLLTVGSNPSYQQSWIESHKSQLVELSEYIQLEMKQQITNDVISDIQNTKPGLLSGTVTKGNPED
jgi:chromosome segregation ATPase